MPTPEIPTEVLEATVAAYNAAQGDQSAAAEAMGLARSTLQNRLKRAAERGLMGTAAVLPGFRIAKITNSPHGDTVQQKPERGEPYKPIDALALKGRTSWNDILPDGQRIATREVVMERADAKAQMDAMRAAVAGFKDEIPRAGAVVPIPAWSNEDLLCQYTITDAHLGALAWNEETGSGDYDLTIGEKLIIDWFAAAIAVSPNAKRGVFAQLGDFLHYDSFKSVTPEHGHLLDGDTRYPKMVRAAIRIVRRVIKMLLEKHEFVDVIMCDANHDPSGEVWLRELIASHYDNEPRVNVDTSPGTYSMLEHGDVTLFYHHGHRRGVGNVDSVFVGKFREAYGRTRFSYAHIGHKHQDELKNTNLMKVEMHETLAAPDAYAANGGWLSGRSAKVIYYHRKYGFVGNNVMTPEMVLGASDLPVAANDNEVRRAA